MDISDEHTINQGKDTSILPESCVASPSSIGMEHIIPQMIVTLADDTPEDKQDVYQTSTSEEPLSSEISSDVFVQKETDGSSTKNVEQIPSAHVEDTASSVNRNEEFVATSEVETKSLESVSHSIAQRPLIIDSEKSISRSNIHESDVIGSVAEPEPTPITATQRPLIFNGSRAQSEGPQVTQEQEISDNLVKQNLTEEEIPPLDMQVCEPESSDAPQETFTPPMSGKDNFSYRDLDERDDLIRGKDVNEGIKPHEKDDQIHVKQESLHNVKKFFGSLIHDTHLEKKPSSQSLAETEPAKTEKHGIKKFFSISKSDSPAKDKMSHTSIDEQLQPKTKSKETESKDSKYNIKKMFDSFKHESGDQNVKVVDKTKIDANKTKIDLDKTKIDAEKIKIDAEKIKIDAEKIKIDADKTRIDADIDDSTFQHKDSRSGIKKFFDSFKHDDSNTQSVEASLSKEEKEIFIRAPVTVPLNVEAAKKSDTSINKNVGLDSTSASQVSSTKDGQEVDKKKPRESSMKKFLDSFKHEKLDFQKENEKDSVNKISEKKSSIKKSHSFKEDLLIKSKEDTEKQPDSMQGVKKFFESFKQSAEAPESFKESNERKSRELKRSQSCRETNERSVTPNSFKLFLDSLTHKKTSQVPRKDNAEHIYDVVGPASSPVASTSNADSKSPVKIEKMKDDQGGVKKLFDSFRHKDEVPRHNESGESVAVTTDTPSKDLKSAVKKTEKHKEDHSGVKKLFDSFRHKEGTHKQKSSDDPKKVRMSDNVTIVSDTNGTCTSSTIAIGENVKSVNQSTLPANEPVTINVELDKKLPANINFEMCKKVPAKIDAEMDKKGPAKIDVEMDKKVPVVQMNGPPTETESKTSVFNSISDNFSTLKGKIFHSKEDKKSKIPEVEPKTEMYDLQNASKSEYSGDTAGIYKPLKDPFFDNNFKKEVKDKPSTTTNAKETFPKQTSVIQTSSAAAAEKTKSPKIPISSCYSQHTSPDTLYDTCCFKLAVLFPNKAIEIFSDKGKTPPKKPPKPTAEAVAKARANVVSQRLKEMQRKGQSIGENIPVGYDGIRFADDETESSCDYKDVDNFDYIMDYELINRYKFDNKLQSFSDTSTCSGSYYTAETVTLKDEPFLDASMENVNLEADSSISPASSHSLKSKSQQSNQKPSMIPCATKYSSNIQKPKSVVQTPKKRVPPPLPPKPLIAPKKTDSINKADGKCPVSPSINGLSLSPRLTAKFSKDTAATKNRPLLVAGLKETDFNSLPSKLKDKQPKDRKFDKVLKNESLTKISTIPLEHQPLTATKSSPGILSVQSGTGTLTKKTTPQRPPLPSVSSPDKAATKTKSPPQVPQKPKREHQSPTSTCERRTISPTSTCEKRTISPTSTCQKRTISPPRPPPPTTLKFSSPPPRPPPPISGFQSPEKCSDFPIIGEQSDQASASSSRDMEEFYPCSSIISESLNDSQSVPDLTSVDIRQVSENSLVCQSNEENETIKTDAKNVSSVEYDFKDKVAVQEISPTVEKTDFTPKPPPRGRRIRSRTVEVAKVEKVSEPLRRSQSLSDVDIHKKISSLTPPAEKLDLKHLYTSVNKNGKKSLTQSDSSSVEKLSGRPLPAPPPPPRKFRSLDRKHKDKEKKPVELMQTSEHNEVSNEAIVSDVQIQPPVRKKKSDSVRFHSLGHDHSRNNSGTRSPEDDTKIARSLSVPLRPERRHHKHSNVEYDENANVAISVEAEVHRSEVTLDECGNEIFNIPNDNVVDSVDNAKIVPHPRQKKEKSRTKSHSSWYDESQGSGDWEIVDWTPTDETENKTILTSKSRPKRRSSDPQGTKQRTSKFYVDVQTEGSFLPLVDKETSPVPLDCSEKSVQTSLETLSQGIHSQTEEDDDTDELLNLAQTLQNELKVIINRHKSTSEANNDSDATNTPVHSATESEDISNKGELHSRIKKSPSIPSSNSELWPLTSSEESENELPADGSANLTEIAKTRKQKKIFYIAQEIMTSEEVFVDTLKLLNVDFKGAVEAANQQRGTAVIPEEVMSQILNHLPQLQHLNENLLMELKDRIENWDKVSKIADIIVKMGPFLKLYSWYIHDFEYTLSLLEDSKKKFPLFAQTVKDFENSSKCKRLALNHYMLKPIQRIPQYRLLLQEYLHHLPEEHVDYQDTVAALQIVSEVATHANDSMKHGDNAQKLISIQNSILGHKEIIKPGRLFIKEGELMKLSRKGMQPRWFVLFNDLLLYLTPVQQGLFRVNHELSLTGMKVAIPIQQDYQNEFSIISVARSFTLAARSPEERQEWIVALTKAIEDIKSKRSTFTNIRLQQKSQDKESKDEDGEFVLGRKAPVWIPDARVTMCQLCTSEFTVTFRRHHCRACGKVVCSICSSNRISLPYLGNRIARVCDDCHLKLGPGSGTATESAETDSDNQQIAVKPHLRTEIKHIKRGKRNLPSVLKEVCANDQGSIISGYLQKKSTKHWKREWFVVKDKVLYEYKASEDVAALKSVPLLGYQIETFTEPYENMDPSLLFQLTHPGQAPIIFHADSVGSTERWITALKEASVLE